MSQSGYKALDELLAGKGAYRIVDQHGVDLAGIDVTGERLDTGKFGAMTDVPATHDSTELWKSCLQRVTGRDVEGPSHHDDVAHLRRRLEEGERSLENRAARDLDEHLVLSPLPGSAFPARHDNGRCGHFRISTRTLRRAALHRSIRLLTSVPVPTRSRTCIRVSRRNVQGPRASTNVSLGMVRRTNPSTTSLQVSVTGTARTVTSYPPPWPSTPPPRPSSASGGGKLSTKRVAFGAVFSACRRRATRPGPSATVSAATSASGAAAALDPPQGFGPPYARLTGRGSKDHAAGRGL